MMTLGDAQIATGSQGSDVKRLLEILSGVGYNVSTQTLLVAGFAVLSFFTVARKR